MPDNRRRMFLWVGLVLVLNWLTIAFVNFAPSSITLVGYILGSMFSHATLAACWSALGPARLVWRLPLSFLWVLTLPVALGINLAIRTGSDHDVLLVIGACLLGQWFVLQLPFWVLTLIFGVSLRLADEVKQEPEVERIQFGIRHLLIIMAVGGVLLGIGRIVVPNLSFGGEAPAFIFLVAAAILLTFPLLLAALMRRMAIPGVLLALSMTGVATAVELPLSKSVGIGGPQMGHFIAINVASAILILAVAGIVRMNGYRLCALTAAARP